SQWRDAVLDHFQPRAHPLGAAATPWAAGPAQVVGRRMGWRWLGWELGWGWGWGWGRGRGIQRWVRRIRRWRGHERRWGRRELLVLTPLIPSRFGPHPLSPSPFRRGGTKKDVSCPLSPKGEGDRG